MDPIETDERRMNFTRHTRVLLLLLIYALVGSIGCAASLSPLFGVPGEVPILRATTVTLSALPELCLSFVRGEALSARRDRSQCIENSLKDRYNQGHARILSQRLWWALK